MTEFPLVDDTDDNDADDLLTPAVEQQLESLGVSIPQPIEIEEAPVEPAPEVKEYHFHGVSARRDFVAPNHDDFYPDVNGWNGTKVTSLSEGDAHAENQGYIVGTAEWAGSDDELRKLVEDRGYALIPIGDVIIGSHGRPTVRGVPFDDGEEQVSTGNPKDLLGMKKPNLALVPPSSSLYQAQAMMDGAAKYGPYNWRGNPVKAMVYVSAALRHIGAYLDGENVDPVSGVPHLGHGLACLGILADATETGNLLDDRPTVGPSPDMIRRFNDTQSFTK